jgi:hypothetical protein
MRNVRGQKMWRQGFTILWLCAVAAGCNGSTSTASAAPGSAPATSSGGTSASGTGSTSGTSTGTGSSAGTTAGTLLFEQPQVSGIANHFVVPRAASHTGTPQGAFTMVLWQANPFQSNGELVATGWDAGSKTGFTPSAPMAAQLGFRNQTGSSTAQMEDDTVGAYINSQDLPPSSADQKMMISPQFTFQSGSEPVPFASAHTVLNGSMDLQIPTAVGSNAYVVADLLFKGANGVRVSYGVAIFRNGRPSPSAGTGLDAPTNSYMLNSPLGLDQRFVTRAANSAPATGTPWTGWRHFEWSISEAQFVSALEYLTAKFPGAVTSTDPAQYLLAEVHLNAEFHDQGKPAALGWSMRQLMLWTTP